MHRLANCQSVRCVLVWRCGDWLWYWNCERIVPIFRKRTVYNLRKLTHELISLILCTKTSLSACYKYLLMFTVRWYTAATSPNVHSTLSQKEWNEHLGRWLLCTTVLLIFAYFRFYASLYLNPMSLTDVYWHFIYACLCVVELSLQWL